MTAYTTRTLSPAIGVEIRGVDLAAGLSPEQAGEFQALLDRHALLSFPNQSLSIEQQIRFTAYFGEVCDENLSGRRHGFISNRRPDSGVNADSALLWHSDNMWSAYPTSYIVLSGLEVVGDLAPTLFASNIRACQALSPMQRQAIEGLRTINMCDLAPRADGKDVARSFVPVLPQREVRQTLPGDTVLFPRFTYPVIWKHPRTGENLLTVEEDFSVQIDGLSAAQSETIYQSLFATLYDERYVYAHHWQQGDVVIWDNIALQHGRPDFQGAAGVRTLLRTSVQPLHDAHIAAAPRVRELCEITNRAHQAANEHPPAGPSARLEAISTAGSR